MNNPYDLLGEEEKVIVATKVISDKLITLRVRYDTLKKIHGICCARQTVAEEMDKFLNTIEDVGASDTEPCSIIAKMIWEWDDLGVKYIDGKGQAIGRLRQEVFFALRDRGGIIAADDPTTSLKLGGSEVIVTIAGKVIKTFDDPWQSFDFFLGAHLDILHGIEVSSY